MLLNYAKNKYGPSNHHKRPAIQTEDRIQPK